MTLLKSGYFFVPTLYFIGNLYLYHWANRLARPPAKFRRAIFWYLILLLALFPVSKIWGVHDFNSFNQILSLFSSLWMGMSFLVILMALGSDIFQVSRRMILPSALSWPNSVSYRRLLCGGISLGAITLGGYACWEARHVEVTRIEIPLAHLPPELEGMTLVQLSDIHYGMVNENGRLSNIVAQVNELKPDLIVITGDLVDEAVSHMEDMAGPLAQLKSRLGVLAVMGNHEFFAGTDRAETIMRRAGIQVLRNETKVLPGGLQVLGVDDPTMYRRSGKPLPDMDGLIRSLDPNKPSILLYHQPIHFEEAAREGIGLQLSGHVHGPQFFPMIPIARLFYPHLRGLSQSGDSHLYVSRGVGTGGPPMRLGSPPEIVSIRLAGKKT